MNNKTTIVLFVLVIILGGVVLTLQEKSPPPKPTVPPRHVETPTATEHDLVEKDFGDAVDIIVRQADKAQCRFTREAGEDDSLGQWRMIEPAESKVKAWQVDQIAHRLLQLKYSVKYEGKDSSEIDLDTAGLNPARATVTLKNAKGEEIKFWLGRQEGDNETYVRLNESATIYRVKGSLKNLLQKSSLEYRELQLFDVDSKDVVRISVVETPDEGDPQTYTMVKTGVDWLFTEPVKTPAMADEVKKLVDAFVGLRAMSWVQDAFDDPAVFGLGEKALRISVTAEETIQPADDANSNGKQTAPETRITEHTVLLSKVAPLGEDNKIYIRRGNETLVGVIMRSTYDTFKPNLKQWRDNRLVTKDPLTARKFVLTVGESSATFTRGGVDWSFADGLSADRELLEEYLRVLKDTNAVNFVPGGSTQPESFGLQNPQATIELTFDGDETPVRLTVGDYADPKTKRLVYLQISDNDSVAKIRVQDAEALLKKPVEFRDRTIINTPADKFESISIKSTGDGSGTDKIVTVSRTSDTWQMTSPVSAKGNGANIASLTELLSELRAEKLIDKPNLEEYGLDKPQLVLSYSFLPPIAYKMKKPENKEGEEQAQPTLQQYQPPAETRVFAFSQKDSNTYAICTANPGLVYQVNSALWYALTAELRDTALLDFDEGEVSSVLVEENGDVQGFRGTTSAWEYVPEKDIPVDATKIANYVLQIKDIRADRYVDYQVVDLVRYGLDKPAISVTVDIKGVSLPALQVSSQTDSEGGHYGKLADSNDVFVLPPDALNRIRIHIEEFEKQD